MHPPPTDRAPTVLVIDDSPTFRNALGRALEKAGYAVLEASTGEEGLRVAAAQRPTAMLVDGMLPSIDGATVIRRVRMDAALRRVPCVLLTASDDGGAELRALDAGADAFVRKEEDLDFILARLTATLRRASSADADTESLLGPKRILAVDDSVTYLSELASMLREDGCEVVLARSGEEAIDLLTVQPVDCILLDLLMPGLGGRETCRRIKTSPVLRDVPLLMLTGLAERDAMLDGLSIGADDWISKSSDFDCSRRVARPAVQEPGHSVHDGEHTRAPARIGLDGAELGAADARDAVDFCQCLVGEGAGAADDLHRAGVPLHQVVGSGAAAPSLPSASHWLKKPPRG